MTDIETYEVTLAQGDRSVSFRMHHDPASICDINTRKLAPIGCEPEVAQFMIRVLREGDTVIDAGANVGFFTVLMAKLVGPTGHVIAFEPNRDTFDRLCDNVLLNQTPGAEIVVPRLTALWDSVRDLPLYTNPIDPGLTTLRAFREVNGSQYVRTAVLDHGVAGKPRLIKIDIEGAECHALAGAERLLTVDRVPFILSELNEPALRRFGKSAHDLRDFMRHHGYDTFVPQPDGSMPFLVPPRTRLVGGPENTNVLFASVDDVARIYPEVKVEQRRS
jgi:FkbM family methyltransferase